MKIKKLKIYSLAILLIFLLNLKIHAIIINIEKPLPSNFIEQSPSINRTNRLIKEYIEEDKKDEIINKLNNMQNDTKNSTNKINIKTGTFADRQNLGLLVQFITFTLDDKFLDFNFISKIPIIESQLLTSPDFNFQVSDINSEENKKQLTEYLKSTANTQTPINFNPNLWDGSFKFEETWELTESNIHHQYILVNFNTEFLLFSFKSPVNK